MANIATVKEKIRIRLLAAGWKESTNPALGMAFVHSDILAEEILVDVNNYYEVNGTFDPTSGLPENPAERDSYLSIATANGWITNDLYTYKNGSWVHTSFKPGLILYNKASDTYSGSYSTGWKILGGGTSTYVHPSGDGNLHVPATGTSNNGKALVAGSTAGSLSWTTIDKSFVGLGNVDNTSDANKPVSTATQTALSGKEAALGNPSTNGYLLSSTAAGARSWVAPYSHPSGDGNLHVPATGTSNNGKVLKAGSTAGSLSWVTVDKTFVGLGNVDNTSDANKPVSTATQTALSGKEAALGNPSTNGYLLSSTAAGARSWVAPYSHPSGDGNLHVPATGTSNNGKILKAGSTAGSLSWGMLTYNDVGASSSTHTHTQLWSVSHPANYYISNTWEAGIDGVYRWRIKSNHSDLASVAWSDNTYSMAGLPYTQWARSDVWYADGGDFNNCIDHSGISSISAIANTPFGSGWYTLYNARHRGGISDGNVWGSQITIGMTAYENRIAFRNHYNNTWRAWTELWTTANLNNTTDFKLHTLALGGVNDYDTNETPSLGALTNKLRTYNNGDSSFGFGVSINSQNYSVPTDMRHRFWVGGTEKMSIRQNDIYMNPNGGDGITFSGDNGFINRIYANQSSSSWLMLTSGGAEIELRGTNNDERITFNGKSRFYNDVIIDGDLNLPYGNITCPNTTTYFGSMTTPYPDSGQSYSISGGGIYSSIVTNVGAGYLNGVSFGSGRLTFQHEGYYIVWYSMSVSSNANTFAKTRIRAFYPDNSTAYGMEGFVDVNGSTARTISVTSILYMPAGTQLNLQGTLNVAGTLYVYNYQFHAVRISYQL